MIRKDSGDFAPWNEEGEALWRTAIDTQEAQKEIEEEKPWPESTFNFETDGTPHYMGSHWDAFYEHGVKEIIEYLPKIVETGYPVSGFVDMDNPPRSLPQSWITGHHRIWPQQDRGAIVTIAADHKNKQMRVCTLFPFWPDGTSHRLVIRKVSIWESGVEAQISVELGDAGITFFDAHYLLNRGWYAQGKEYDFILTGIAYDAKPAEDREMPFTPHPDQVAWETMLARQRGEEPPEMTGSVHLGGLACLLPIPQWDADDFMFRGPVKTVKPFSGFLGQDGWLVGVTVMRFSNAQADVDLNIVITSRAWAGEAAPEVGQDIEGGLWLQGYLKRAY